jgi:hypothetical protein
MIDGRLLGGWRSDAPRTKLEIRARRDISPRGRRLLGGLLGKLELRFTRTRCLATLNGNVESTPYTVVAKDASTVAIVSPDFLTGKTVIQHVHFVGETQFWINVGTGVFREFFRRVRPSTMALPPTNRARRNSKSQKRRRAIRG